MTDPIYTLHITPYIAVQGSAADFRRWGLPLPAPAAPPRIELRCADCQRPVDRAAGRDHLPWCPFAGAADFPRL